MTRHVYSPIPLTISEKTWQKLSPADQKAVTQAAVEAGAWNRIEVKSSEEKQMAEMASKGAKINSPNLAPFREAVKPTLEKAKAKYGADVDAIMADVNAVRKALPVKQ
jgi:TRAP-type C4-dicarboxylate transport system substrate-binding protein